MQGQNQTFVWIDGSAMDWAIKWRSGEPNNRGGRENVAFYGTNTKQFNDAPDTTRVGAWVCSKKC